ncbi:MAG: HepT-like ribonuclease domain-containing protein [Bacilli bacterium]
MNQERLIKIIEDMQECVTDIYECLDILDNRTDDKLIIKLSKSSLRQLFVSFHTILEDLCSIILKEINKYKIGITLYDSFNILKENNIIDEDTYIFLEKSRLLRNRISHRYKEPTHEDLLEHIIIYNANFNKIVILAKSYLS